MWYWVELMLVGGLLLWLGIRAYIDTLVGLDPRQVVVYKGGGGYMKEQEQVTTEKHLSAEQRVVCWFSCGDASAVACALALKKYPDAIVVRIDLTTEHPDNDRFAADCAKWYGKDIQVIRSDKYADTWAVWEDRRYIAGIQGAPCTTELKKAVRFKFQRVDDLHVFGFTAEEANRADRFKHSNPELDVWFPLIEAQLTKGDCHAVVQSAGIEIPAMYKLGFDNNNCIGCPKGGAGYWNMIRKHFPDHFARMAELSRRLGARLIKQGGVRIFLDELKPETGRQKDEVAIDCTPFCDAAIAEVT